MNITRHRMLEFLAMGALAVVMVIPALALTALDRGDDAGFPPVGVLDPSIVAANMSEYDLLAKQIAEQGKINGFASTAFNTEALIAASDTDPADVVLRRASALLADLKATAPAKGWEEYQAQLSALILKSKSADRSNKDARLNLYLEACGVRRRIALANPLLNFDKLVFAKHYRSFSYHMCDQYFGFAAAPGGGIFVLENAFGANPKLRDILANSVVQSGRLKDKQLTQQGSYLSPSLSYDGNTLFFAYTENAEGDLPTGVAAEPSWTPEKCYHIFKVGVDGSNLQQLTDGPWNDFDPCQMPNGKVVFISERRGGYGRCHGRPVPVYTLHTMTPDGQDITCISYHESNEWNPAINNDGMIIYSRWDYVDRGFNQAHHPWITTPDGRDARAIQGNYPDRLASRPWLEVHMHPIPDSQKYLAVAGPHHGQAYGSLVIIDPRVPDDGAMAQVRRLTPDAAFPESEDTSYPFGIAYGTAWPLSEKYYIGIYNGSYDKAGTWDRKGMWIRDPRNTLHGIWLIDCFGNRELIYRDPTFSCLAPMPLKPRKVPSVVPDMLKPADHTTETGTIAVMNVYDSLKQWPKDTRIKALRIMEVLPKTTPNADNPRIGYGCQKSARMVLGSVPVEEDGSAYFNAPAKKAIFFQALDEKGMAVQSMRSDTYIQPGERLVCQGCHNQVKQSPDRTSLTPMALMREPSNIVRDAEGSYPFNYPRLVQDVLNRNCVNCHSKNPKAPDLAAADGGQNGWSRSYVSLKDHAFFFDNPAETTSSTIPGAFGARASRLYKMLAAGHHDVKLSKDDMHRLTLWMDCNSDFYGSYENTEAQSRGEIIWPALY